MLRDMWSMADTIVLILYFVIVLSVGFMMHKRASTSFKSFFVASRRLTIPVMVGVACAGWYDSWSIVGMAEMGTTIGVSIFFIWLIPSTIFRLPLALWIGPLTRTVIPDHVLTLPDIVEYFYDKKSRVFACFTVSVIVLYSAALLFAAGEILHLTTGWNLYIGMILAGGVVLAYTALAGLWGLAVTDMIQFVVMTVSAGVLLLGIMGNYGGLPNLWAEVDAIDPVLTTVFGHNSAFVVLGWVVSSASLYVSAQSYQRFGAAKSSGDIKVAYPLMMLIGLCYCSTFVIGGMAAMVEYADLAPAEGFWMIVFNSMAPGFRGLFIAAFCAAIMSTVSADWLVASTAVFHDFWVSYFRPKTEDVKIVAGTRRVLCCVAILSVIGTYFWRNGIGQAWYYVGGFQVAIMMVPLVAGFFYKRKTATGGFSAFVIGAITYAIWMFALGEPFGVPSHLVTWCVSLVVYFVVCNVTYSKEGPKQINA